MSTLHPPVSSLPYRSMVNMWSDHMVIWSERRQTMKGMEEEDGGEAAAKENRRRAASEISLAALKLKRRGF